MKRLDTFLLAALVLAATALPAAAQTFRGNPRSESALAGYGGAVAIGGRQLFVSESRNQITSGIVYVYDRGTDGTWIESARLTPSDAEVGDGFGSTLAASDGRVVVTSSGEAAYVFDRDDSGTWRQTARVTAVDGIEGDRFGAAVALSGDRVLVGAFAHNDSTGAAYLFRRTAEGEWAEEGKLVGEDSKAKDRFGVSVALDGDRALIGATRKDNAKGAVYVFERGEDSTWGQTSTLKAAGLGNNSRFGGTLLLRGDHAVVGVPRLDGNVGAAFVFELNEDGEWSQLLRLNPFDGVSNTRFGSTLSATDDELWVGAIGVQGFQGAVYRMPHSSLGWSGSTKLTGANVKRRELFAGSIAVSGDVAIAGVTGADHGEGTAIVFEKDENGQWKETQTIFSQPAVALEAVSGGQVDCSDGSAGRFPCEAVDMVSFLPVLQMGGTRGIRTNDIWGWTDPDTGKEYALVGKMDGTAFVDVSDPYSPTYLGSLAMTEGAIANAWRDIKVYENYAYIVADGAGKHGMQVFDLTQLRTAGPTPVEFQATALYDGFDSAHNIVINEESGFAYAVGVSGGGESCGGGLHMISLENPTEPRFAGCFSDPTTGRNKTGYTHDAQCVNYHGPDADYAGHEICLGANETALSIADVTDKSNPVAISMATYPNVGYTHQGWLTENHRYFYSNDELDELNGLVASTRTLVWDVADLDDPVLVKEYFSDSPSIDHNLYIKGNLMYQSNYVSGLHVLDISEPENPVQVGYFDTVPWGDDSPRFAGSWSNYPFFDSGVIVVTSGSEGLFVLRKKDARLVP